MGKIIMSQPVGIVSAIPGKTVLYVNDEGTLATKNESGIISSVTKNINLTYDELLELIQNDELEVGKKYTITDYVSKNLVHPEIYVSDLDIWSQEIYTSVSSRNITIVAITSSKFDSIGTCNINDEKYDILFDIHANSIASKIELTEVDVDYPDINKLGLHPINQKLASEREPFYLLMTFDSGKILEISVPYSFGIEHYPLIKGPANKLPLKSEHVLQVPTGYTLEDIIDGVYFNFDDNEILFDIIGFTFGAGVTSLDLQFKREIATCKGKIRQMVDPELKISYPGNYIDMRRRMYKMEFSTAPDLGIDDEYAAATPDEISPISGIIALSGDSELIPVIDMTQDVRNLIVEKTANVVIKERAINSIISGLTEPAFIKEIVESNIIPEN